MRSIYSPFSVFRHLDFWSVAAHGGDDNGGGGNGGSGDNKSSSQPAAAAPAPAPAPKPAATPTFKNLTEASKAGYHGQAVNIAGKGLQKVSFGDKSYDKKMASASASAKQPSVGTSNSKASSNYTSPGQSGQDFATQFKADPSAFMPPVPGPGSNKVNSAVENLKNALTPFDNKEYVGGDLIDTSLPSPGADDEFQERFRTQKIAAAADPYGGSTQSGAVLTSQATDMLDSAGASAQDYVDAVDAFGARLDKPATGLAAISPVLNFLGQMDDRRAYEQLTGDYEPSGVARMLGIADSTTVRYVPVMEGGQIVGSLSVDASGNPVAYTGSRTDNPVIMDPTVDKEAAMAQIRRPDAVAGGSNASDDGPGYSIDLTSGDGAAVSGDVDPCPEGYRMNPETNVCEIDPFQEPFPVTPSPIIPTPPGSGTVPPGTVPPGTVLPLSAYTAASPYTLPSLLPQGQSTFTVPTPNVQPITVAQQTATGLAGLPFRRS